MRELCGQELCQLGCRTACAFYQQTGRLTSNASRNRTAAMHRKVSNQNGGSTDRLGLSARGVRPVTITLLLTGCRLYWSRADGLVVYLLVGRDRWAFFFSLCLSLFFVCLSQFISVSVHSLSACLALSLSHRLRLSLSCTTFFLRSHTLTRAISFI